MAKKKNAFEQAQGLFNQVVSGVGNLASKEAHAMLPIQTFHRGNSIPQRQPINWGRVANNFGNQIQQNVQQSYNRPIAITPFTPQLRVTPHQLVGNPIVKSLAPGLDQLARGDFSGYKNSLVKGTPEFQQARKNEFSKNPQLKKQAQQYFFNQNLNLATGTIGGGGKVAEKQASKQFGQGLQKFAQAAKNDEFVKELKTNAAFKKLFPEGVDVAKQQKKVTFRVNDALATLKEQGRKFKNAVSDETGSVRLDLGLTGGGKKLSSKVRQGESSTNIIPQDVKGGLSDVAPQLKVKLPSGKVPQVLRVGKFNLNPQQSQVILDLQKKLGLETRGVQSFEDMQGLAEQLGTDPNKLLREVKSNRLTSSEVTALGDIISSSSQRISQLSKDLAAAPGDLTIMQKINAEQDVLNQALRKRIKGGTEAGRSVAAFRIVANKTMDPAYWLSKAKDQIGAEKDLPAEVATAIQDLIGKNDRAGLANFVSKLGESSQWEKAVGLWKAGLLTGPKTHLANIIGNTAMQALETVKDVPATGFDIARSAITGGPRAKSVGLGTLTSQISSIPRGLQKGKQVLTEGVTAEDLLKTDVRKPLRYGDSRGGKIAQAYTNIIFRALGAEDKVFKELAFSRSISEQARVGEMNGLGKAVDLLTSPTKEMLQQATRDAEIATFNSPNKVADMVRAAKNAGGPAASAVLDVLAPFVRTPTNVAARIVDYTPVGFPIKLAKKLIKADSVTNKDIAESFGRSTTGLGILALGYELAKHGRLSGAAPSSISEKNEKNLEGQTPNSILINGKWRSIQRISPIGNLLIMGAEAFNSGLNPIDITAAGLKGVTDQTFLKGVAGALSAINDPQQNAAAYFNSLISGVIPTLSGNIATGIDPYVRKPKGVLESVEAKIPGLRERVPTYLNQLGDAVPNTSGLLGTLFDPFNSRPASQDPMVKEFHRVGYNLNFVGDTINNQALTRDQQREYQRLSGQYIKQIVPDVINSQAYQGLDKDSQRDIIEKLVNNAKAQAREEVKANLDKITSDSGGVASAAENSYGKAVQPVIKTKEPPMYEQTADQPKNIVDKIVLASQAITKDPHNVIKAIFTQEEMRKMRGDALILKRQTNLNNTIDTSDAVDHTVSLGLGGDNAQSNLTYMNKEEKKQKDKLEKKLIKQLQDGTINRKEAQQQIKAFVADKALGTPYNQVNKDTVIPTQPSIITPKNSIATTTSDKIAKQKVKATNQLLVQDGRVYYPDPNTGNVKVIDIATPLAKPTYTGEYAIDKIKLANYKSEISKKINDVVTLVDLKQLSPQEGNELVIQLQAMQKNATATSNGLRVSGGTGRKKGRKAKGINYSALKFPKIKQPNYKPIKLNVKLRNPHKAKIKAPKYKPVKFKYVSPR